MVVFLPDPAIHLWLGEEGEKSTLMYMVGEGEAYSNAVERLQIN